MARESGWWTYHLFYQQTLKALDTIGLKLKIIIISIKTLYRATESCWYYKTLWETPPSEVMYSVWERNKFSLKYLNFDFETSEFDFEVSKSSISSTQLRVAGRFFFHLAISTTNWVHIFTGLLFYACWDTPSESGLWRLPIVSSAFNKRIIISCY